MPKSSTPRDAAVLSKVIAALQELAPDARKRVRPTLGTVLGETKESLFYPSRAAETVSVVDAPERRSHVPFADDRVMSPKAFMLEKQQKTSVERIACLAHYL